MESEERRWAIEESATGWPPRDYRIWVRNEVAAEIVRRRSRWFAGISATVVLAIGAVTYNFYQSIVKLVSGYITEQAADVVKTDVLKELQSSVAEVILNKAGMQEALVDRINDSLPFYVNKITSSDEFMLKVFNLVKSGMLNNIMSENALKGAKNIDTTLGVRQVGLELYALLADDRTTPDEKSKYQAAFIDIADRFNDLKEPLPEEYLSAFVGFYPFGPADDANAGCDSGSPCEQEKQLIENLLRYFVNSEAGKQANYKPESLDGLARRLSAMGPASYDTVDTWNERSPDNPFLLALNKAIAREGSDELLAEMLDSMVDLLDRRDPAREALAFASLSEIRPSASLDDTQRRTALAALWPVLKDRPQQLFGEWLASSSSSEVAQDAVIRLLRPMAGDWDELVIPKLAENGIPAPELYARWRERIALDGATDPKPWDQMLRTANKQIPTRKKGQPFVPAIDVAGEALKDGVRFASIDVVGEFGDALVKDHKTTGEFTEWLLAPAVVRLGSDDAAETWFTTNLKKKTHRDLILAYLDPANESKPIWDIKERDSMNAAARYVVAQLAAGGQSANASIVATEIAGRLDAVSVCPPLAALEMSGLAASLKYGDYPIQENGALAGARDKILAAMPWIGETLETDEVELEMGKPYPLEAPIPTDGPGGRWIRIAADKPVSLEYDVPSGLEVVVMDASRMRVVGRGDSSAKISSLDAGEYALGMRACSPARDNASLSFKVGPGMTVVGTATQKDPYVVRRSGIYQVSGGAGKEDAWFSLEMAAGQALIAATSSDNVNLDTRIELFRRGDGEEAGSADPWAAYGQPVGQDDDGGGGRFSRLVFVASEAGDYRLRLSKYNDSLGPEDVVRISMEPDGESRPAATAIASAPRIAVDETTIVSLLSDGPGYVKIVPESDALVSLDIAVDAGFHDQAAILAADGSPLRRFQDSEQLTDIWVLSGGKTYYAELPSGRTASLTPRTAPTLAFADLSDGSIDLRRPSAVRLPTGETTVELTYDPEREGAVDVVVLSSPSSESPPAAHVVRSAIVSPLVLDQPEPGMLVGRAEGFAPALRFNLAEPALALLQLRAPVDASTFPVGARVRLGRHTVVAGSDNWDAAMDKYVGCLARIDSLGVDGSGLEVAYVDLAYPPDEYSWIWRLANMQRVADDEPQPERCLDYTN